MKKLKTTNNVTFLIDDEDYERVFRHKWNFYDRYVETHIKNKTTKLSRYILNAPKNLYVDHINHNRLDNRKKNLRLCTHSQNQMNRKVNCNNKCGHKGIQLMKSGIYRVRVQKDGVRHHVGCYKKLSDAIKAREDTAKEMHGEFYRKK